MLATIYSELGREEEARTHVSEVLRVNPRLSLEWSKDFPSKIQLI